MTSELHLFVLWQKARQIEARMLKDLADRGFEVVCTREFSFGEPAGLAYRHFYGPSLPDEKRKVASCGSGPFLLVVVRDPEPRYDVADIGSSVPVRCNVRMLELKTLYREWAGRHHRVHGTITTAEFARDVFLLTGFTGADWERGVPEGDFRLQQPVAWVSRPEEPRWAEPVFGTESDDLVRSVASALKLENLSIFLENKYINDVFLTGTCAGTPCIVKVSSKAVWSIRNEFYVGGELAAVKASVARPLGYAYSADGRRALVVSERLAGPSLTDLLKRGLTSDEATCFAADIHALAQALKTTKIVHRDLFSDNLLLDSDGHLKAIDFQLAIHREHYKEDPWVVRHWKFRYVVFGVNRELGLGVWSDFHALGKILASFPQLEAVRTVRAALAADEKEMVFAARPDAVTSFRLFCYGCSLRLQMLLNWNRPEKRARLERRWRTVRCRW